MFSNRDVTSAGSPITTLTEKVWSVAFKKASRKRSLGKDATPWDHQDRPLDHPGLMHVWEPVF